MKKSIDNYIESIVHECGCYIGNNTIAEYIIKSAEHSGSWNEFFDDDELNGGDASETDIEYLKEYLELCWDCYLWDIY